MSDAGALIQEAFARLAHRSEFSTRPGQVQLAQVLGDLIEGEQSGLVEAPTGLGKSLAGLVPAIANAIVSGKRTVIATYTNILAEQYWQNDLPLARSLFDAGDAVRAQFLVGRQRYVCLVGLDEANPRQVDRIRDGLTLGIETEFRRTVRGDLGAQMWPRVSVPPVCPARLCPVYDDCYYYQARRRAEDAAILITNHSVVIQDAIMKTASEGAMSLLGPYDYLILDEAHDFPAAAQNGLEFELSPPRIAIAASVLTRLDVLVQPVVGFADNAPDWITACAEFRGALDHAQRELTGFGASHGESGILRCSPAELGESAAIRSAKAIHGAQELPQLAEELAQAAAQFTKRAADLLAGWRASMPERMRGVVETSRTYLMYLGEFRSGVNAIFEPQGVSVSYIGRTGADSMLRQDTIGLAEPLSDLLWSRTPYACLSATLALDGTFDYFRRVTGVRPDFEEMLPSPFDFGHQAAVYLPRTGSVPDPTVARREGGEIRYFDAIAREIGEIIAACEGRTLALFHSRREMEAVFARMRVSPEYPVLLQPRTGAMSVGHRFREDPATCLFALRSFWTGFDAPGETLSCVVLVRVPFEVPIEPAAITRMAYLQSQGIDPFTEHTLAQAKMMMRQGAGRLIRRESDRGVIALLDPRLRTKRYGEAILENLPPGMRTFDSIADAVGWIGLGEAQRPDPASAG